MLNPLDDESLRTVRVAEFDLRIRLFFCPNLDRYCKSVVVFKHRFADVFLCVGFDDQVPVARLDRGVLLGQRQLKSRLVTRARL